MKETINHSFDEDSLNAWFKGSGDHVPQESNPNIGKENSLAVNVRTVCTKAGCLPELTDKAANLGVSVVKIFLAVFVIIFMFELSIWIVFGGDHIIVDPYFKTTGMNESLDGRSIADLLNWGLYDIIETDYQASQIAVPSGVSDKLYNVTITGRVSDKDVKLSNTISVSLGSAPLRNEPPLFKDSSIENSLPKIGSVGIGGASLPLGDVILLMRELCHKDPCTIEGGLQKYGSTLMIIASSRGGSIKEGVWEVRKNLSEDNLPIEEHIPSMIENLSYKIVLDLGRQRQLQSDQNWTAWLKSLFLPDPDKQKQPQSDLPRTWQALKFTVACERAYISYSTTRNNSDLNKAREMALNALQSDPNCNKSIDLLTCLALFCLDEKKTDMAETLFNDTQRFRPAGSEAGSGLGLIYTIGQIYTEKGDYVEAVRAFNEAIRLDPSLAPAWYNKGIALMADGMYDEALQAFNEAIGLKDNYSEAWCYKGWILIRQGKYDDAIASLDNAITINPNYADAWNEKGNALLYEEKYEKALEAKDKALELDPSLYYIWYDKGLVLYSMKRYDEALKAFDAAQVLHPSDPDIWRMKEMTATRLAEQSELNKTTVSYDNITDDDKQKVMNFLNETGGEFTL